MVDYPIMRLEILIVDLKKGLCNNVNSLVADNIYAYCMKYNCTKLWKTKKVKAILTKAYHQFIGEYLKTHAYLPDNAYKMWEKGAKKAFTQRCKNANTRRH